MNVEERLLCLFLELMTLDKTVVLRMDATACARQVQKMMELVIWNLTMGIGCTSIKLIPSVIMGFKVIQPRTHFIYPSKSFPCVCMFLFIFLSKVQDCFHDDSSYSPIDFPGQGRTDAADPEACQSRCAYVDGCSYFTFWPNDNACHLSSSTATRIPDQYRAISGPKICEEDCKLYIIFYLSVKIRLLF